MEQKIIHELYVRYGRELYLYLFSMCKMKETAEDLMQETFLKAILAMPDDVRNMRSWLYRVARNLCLNHMKKEKNIMPSEYLKDLSVNNDMLDRLIFEEQQRKLYKAMNQLSGSKREVLTLQYFARLSQKEIASVLQMTPENVRVLAFRAKNDLKKYMELPV